MAFRFLFWKFFKMSNLRPIKIKNKNLFICPFLVLSIKISDSIYIIFIAFHQQRISWLNFFRSFFSINFLSSLNWLPWFKREEKPRLEWRHLSLKFICFLEMAQRWSRFDEPINVYLNLFLDWLMHWPDLDQL